MIQVLFVSLFALVAGPALAGNASLKNTDSASHAIAVDCGAGTTKRTLNANTVIQVGDGCKVSVERSTATEVKSGQSCTIKDSKLSCS